MLFGAVFLLCAPWTLLDNEHIRIDIVNSRFSPNVRDWIDLLGHVLFLLPFVRRDDRDELAVLHDVVEPREHLISSSASTSSRSTPAACRNGRPSSLIPLGFVLLFLQGISELIKRIAVMRGRIPDPHGGQAAICRPRRRPSAWPARRGRAER